MKGIVFKELLEMVEEAHGYEVVDKVLNRVTLQSDGAYTSVGSYDHSEILTIVSELSEELSVPVKDLVILFGQHLISAFASGHPQDRNQAGRPDSGLAARRTRGAAAAAPFSCSSWRKTAML